jgi:hypothetical protein
MPTMQDGTVMIGDAYCLLTRAEAIPQRILRQGRRRTVAAGIDSLFYLMPFDVASQNKSIEFIPELA